MVHYHYIVQGFEIYEKDGGLGDVCTIDVFANSEKEAMEEARSLIKKKHYRIQSVVAHDPDMEGATQTFPIPQLAG